MEMLMRKLSRLGLFLIAATAMGCAYPELKMGAAALTLLLHSGHWW